MERIERFALAHPRVVQLVTGALVVWAAADLGAAIRLHVAARRIVGQLQREASESLGG